MSASGRASRPPAIWLWLSGRDLSGHWHTNATWLHDATKVLHVTGNATRWQRMRHWKRSAIRNGIPALSAVSAWDWWHHPVLTPAILSLLAVTPASHYTWRAARTFLPVRHYWQWVRPLRHTLKAELGVVPERLAIEPDRSKAVIVLPEEFLGTEPARAAITKAVTEKLGMIEPDPAWKLRGCSHEVEFRQSEPPPLEVLPHHVLPAIEAAKEHEYVHGLDKHGDPVIRSVDLDSPHMCHCMESGGGKSYALMNVGCQHLHHGGVLIILDIKMLSHMWANGLPNVVYAYTPEMVHQVLCWLACDDGQESELTYRKRIGRKHADIRGNIQTDLGPRFLIFAEEQNDTQRALRAVWKKMGGKGPSPAAEALDTLSYTGRQLKMHVDYAVQRGSAKALGSGGTADSRENVGLWFFSNPKDRTWQMLGEGYAKPPPSDHTGRYHLLDSGGLTQFQGVLWAPEEAREFAMSGTKAKPHRDLPFTRHDAVVAAHTIDAMEGPDRGVVVGQLPAPIRSPGTATINEAAAAIRLPRGTLAKRVQRASLEHQGWEGKEKLYPVDRLKELVR